MSPIRSAAAAMLVLGVCACGPGSRRVSTPDPAHAAGIESGIVTATNEERRRHGFAPLDGEAVLAAVAASHSRDMLNRGFFQHVNPDGLSPSDRTGWQHRRLFGAAGENIAMIEDPSLDEQAAAARFVQNWMNSPGHRQNILSADWNRIGVGVVRSGAKLMATQVFADARAYSSMDLPTELSELPRLEFTPAEGRIAPGAYDVANLSGERVSAIQEIASAAPERLPPGVYRVRLHVPSGPNRYTLIPGPLFRVRSR